MTNKVSTYYFDTERNNLKYYLIQLEKYDEVNKFLKTQNWLFVSPLFFQGYELELFYKYISREGDFKKEINNLIFRKFFNLNFTASFIEGYCGRCLYIKPFLQSIEHSLILTFQKDYEGAIKTLIPIIEGILRKYLTHEKSLYSEKIGYKHLKQAIDFLKADLIINYEQDLLNYQDQNGNKIYFQDEKIKELVKLKTQYYETWFSFFADFFNNSFYLNTKENKLKNELNRHAILHEYGLKIFYNLENYIKVYFVLQFLTWTFLQKERKSLLNEITPFRYFEKAYAYRNIIKYSRKLIFEKHILNKTHDGYETEIMLSDNPVLMNCLISIKFFIKYLIVRKIEKLFWRRQHLKVKS